MRLAYALENGCQSFPKMTIDTVCVLHILSTMLIDVYNFYPGEVTARSVERFDWNELSPLQCEGSWEMTGAMGERLPPKFPGETTSNWVIRCGLNGGASAGQIEYHTDSSGRNVPYRMHRADEGTVIIYSWVERRVIRDYEPNPERMFPSPYYPAVGTPSPTVPNPHYPPPPDPRPIRQYREIRPTESSPEYFEHRRRYNARERRRFARETQAFRDWQMSQQVREILRQSHQAEHAAANPTEAPFAIDEATSMFTGERMTFEQLIGRAPSVNNPIPVQPDLPTLAENKFKCAHCGCIHDLSEKIDPFVAMPEKARNYFRSSSTPFYYCPECWAHMTFKCPVCSQVTPTGSSVSVVKKIVGMRTQKICVDCRNEHYKKCGHCGYWFEKATPFTETVNGRQICQFCVQSRYFTCANCSGLENREHLYDVGGGRHFCRNCYQQYQGYWIANHSFKVAGKPLGRGPHFMGVELEVECSSLYDPNQQAEYVTKLLKGFVVCKADGSLSHGFEIVTVPADLDTHRTLWLPFFEELPPKIKSYSTDTCGLHVHCSRAPLSALTIGKCLVFMTHANNKRFIETIAGRTANRWSRFKDKHYTDSLRNPEDKYEALNLIPKDTIEFRIFRGTLRRESLFKAIEFCDALIHFELPAHRPYRHCHRLKDFLEFVNDHRKHWPHLQAFIDARWVKHKTRLSERVGYTQTKLAED